MEHETFFTLVTSAAHWELELFIMLLFDVVIGFFLWPFFLLRLKRWTKHHRSDDDKIKVLEDKVKRMEEILGLKEEKIK